MPYTKPIAEYTNHETDDLGFPLNPYCCESCLAKSKAANAEYLQKVLRTNLRPGDLEGADDWSKA